MSVLFHLVNIVCIVIVISDNFELTYCLTIGFEHQIMRHALLYYCSFWRGCLFCLSDLHCTCGLRYIAFTVFYKMKKNDLSKNLTRSISILFLIISETFCRNMTIILLGFVLGLEKNIPKRPLQVNGFYIKELPV